MAVTFGPEIYSIAVNRTNLEWRIHGVVECSNSDIQSALTFSRDHQRRHTAWPI